MITQINWLKQFTWVLIFSFLAACASSPQKPSGDFTPIQDLDAPEWVVKGGAAFDDKAFYGVGLASGIRNSALLRETSDNRARSSLADIFEVYIKKLNKDYMESATTGDMSATSETQYIERAMKSVSSMTLNGSEIVDHWQNPDNGEMYALARVDLETFQQNLDKYKELSAEVRNRIKVQAEKSFEDLDKEVDKKEGR